MMKKQWKNSWNKDIPDSWEENGHKDKAIKRCSFVYFIVGVLLIVEMAALFWNSGVVTQLNPKANLYKKTAMKEADAKTVAGGDIFDRHGTLLVENFAGDKPSQYTDGMIYSQVLGYTGKNEIKMTGQEVIESREDYRLMKYYADTLYQTAGADSTKGNSLVLTLDHSLQTKTAQLLQEEMTMNERGSAIVMDCKTGEILAMVAFPTFDANQLQESKKWMMEADKKEEIYYPVTHKGLEVPGSIFKVVTATALIDSGYEELMVEDKNTLVGGSEIKNAYSSPGDVIDYKQALIRSSNVFFAKAGETIGGLALEKTAKKFLIGQEVELDFGTISSHWKMDSNNIADVAAVSYGQGKTLFSTIYGAMIAQTIGNDGVMLKPYMIKEIKDENGKKILGSKTEVLSEVTSQNTADKITEAMEEATYNSLYSVSKENRAIYKKYQVASKTGTGETGDEKETQNAWLISFAPANDPKYVVVVNQCKTEGKFGSHMMNVAAGIYQYLFEEQ